MKNRFSTTYIIVSCVSLFLFYQALTSFIYFSYSHLQYGPFIALYSILLICSILVAFGKLRSNIYTNLGVLFTFIILMLNFMPMIGYLLLEHIPRYSIFIIPIVLLIIGIFKGRTKSVENISY